MFLEDINNYAKKKGWIEVVCGSMFSGKTEELLRRIKRAQIANQNIKMFKPAVDTRYANRAVVSHNANSIDSQPIKNSKDILKHIDAETEVVGVDEVQFFDDDIVGICNQIANRGIRVVVAGLDMDYLGKPFGPIQGLMATAEYVTKVKAICVNCGGLAHNSLRKVANDNTVMLGEKNEYVALCRDCFCDEINKTETAKSSEKKA